MWTIDFWKAVAERALKTGFQTLAAVITVPTEAGILGILDIDWAWVLSAAALAGILSVCTSIGSGLATGGPSLTSEIIAPRHAWTEAATDD